MKWRTARFRIRRSEVAAAELKKRCEAPPVFSDLR